MPIVPKIDIGQHTGQLPDVQMPQTNLQIPDITFDKTISATEDFLLNEKRKADELAILTYDNDITTEAINIQAEGKKRKGMDAINLTEDSLQRFNNYVAEKQKGAINQTQIAEMRKRAMNRSLDIKAWSEEHTRNEIEHYKNEQDARYIENQRNFAIENKGDSNAVYAAIGRVKDQIYKKGRRLGWNPDEEAENNLIVIEQVKTVSGIHRDIINSFLGEGKDIFAKSWYEVNKNNITGEDRAAIEPVLMDANVNGLGEKIAAEVWEEFKPSRFNIPIKEEPILDKLKSLSGDSDKIFDAAKQAIYEKLNSYYRDENKFNGDNYRIIADMIIQEGADLNSLKKKANDIGMTADVLLPIFLAQRDRIRQENDREIARKKEEYERTQDTLFNHLSLEIQQGKTPTQDIVNLLESGRLVKLNEEIKKSEKEREVKLKEEKETETKRLKGETEKKLLTGVTLEDIPEYEQLKDSPDIQADLLKTARIEIEKRIKEEKEALKESEDENVNALYRYVQVGKNLSFIKGTQEYKDLQKTKAKEITTIENIFAQEEEKKRIIARQNRVEERLERAEKKAEIKEAKEAKKEEIEEAVAQAKEDKKSMQEIADILKSMGASAIQTRETFEKIDKENWDKYKKAKELTEDRIKALKEAEEEQEIKLIKRMRREVDKGKDPKTIIGYDDLKTPSQRALDAEYRTNISWQEARTKHDEVIETEKNRQIVIGLIRDNKPYKGEAYKKLSHEEQDKMDEMRRTKDEMVERAKERKITQEQKEAIDDVAKMRVENIPFETIKNTSAWKKVPGESQLVIIEKEETKEKERIREAKIKKEEEEKVRMGDYLRDLEGKTMEGFQGGLNEITEIDNRIRYFKSIYETDSFKKLSGMGDGSKSRQIRKEIEAEIDDLIKKKDDIIEKDLKVGQTIQFGEILSNLSKYNQKDLDRLLVLNKIDRSQYTEAVKLLNKGEPDDMLLKETNEAIERFRNNMGFVDDKDDIGGNELRYFDAKRILNEIVIKNYGTKDLRDKLREFNEELHKPDREGGVLNLIKRIANLLLTPTGIRLPEEKSTRIERLKKIFNSETGGESKEVKEKTPEDIYVETARRNPKNSNFTDEQIRNFYRKNYKK